MNTQVRKTIILLITYAIALQIGATIEIAKTPIAGALAVEQLQDSDAKYISSTYLTRFMTNTNSGVIISLLFFLGLFLIWRKPIMQIFFTVFTLLLFLVPPPALAYYSKTNYAEVVEILPNQTAFLIPEVGKNKEHQASFLSVDYLNENKVAMKRVEIPHQKLQNSGLLSDYYVPEARLLVIDRTPTTREWVTATNRGTSAVDQGFNFESRESINIRTGIVLSAFVREEDAAKFVYWFGSRTQPNTEQLTDEQRFASVVYGRSLAEVVDDNVRHKVQSVLAREFGKYEFAEAVTKKAEIIAEVEKQVKEAFVPMGITIAFLGYAEPLSFEDEIQKSINAVFIAQKEAERSVALMTTVPYEQAIVNINYINAEAEALKEVANKWNGAINLPNWVILPQEVMGAINNLFPHPTVTKAPTTPAKTN